MTMQLLLPAVCLPDHLPVALRSPLGIRPLDVADAAACCCLPAYLPVALRSPLGVRPHDDDDGLMLTVMFCVCCLRSV